MQSNYPSPEVKTRTSILRAFLEFRNGELSIAPIATCESEEKEILDAIRVLLGAKVLEISA